MSEPSTPATAANTAAEALRTLNHLTLAPPSPGRPGWADLADVYAVVGHLQVLAQRLPQALDQLARAFEDPAVDYGTDNGADPGATLLTAGATLLAARGEAATLHRSLERAQSALSHLYVERCLAVVEDTAGE